MKVRQDSLLEPGVGSGGLPTRRLGGEIQRQRGDRCHGERDGFSFRLSSHQRQENPRSRNRHTSAIAAVFHGKLKFRSESAGFWRRSMESYCPEVPDRRRFYSYLSSYGVVERGPPSRRSARRSDPEHDRGRIGRTFGLRPRPPQPIALGFRDNRQKELLVAFVEQRKSSNCEPSVARHLSRRTPPKQELARNVYVICLVPVLGGPVSLRPQRRQRKQRARRAKRRRARRGLS